MLCRMKLGEPVESAPTVGFNLETVRSPAYPRGIPLGVLANKCDLECAMTHLRRGPAEYPRSCPAARGALPEVVHAWDLARVVDRPWTVRPCSALTGQGVWEALDWLATTLQQKTRIARDLRGHQQGKRSGPATPQSRPPPPLPLQTAEVAARPPRPGRCVCGSD
eukprot:gene33622-34896_t